MVQHAAAFRPGTPNQCYDCGTPITAGTVCGDCKRAKDMFSSPQWIYDFKEFMKNSESGKNNTCE